MQANKTKYLNALFAYFGEQNIAYCVVGDTAALPEVISSDIDIVISRHDFLTIKEKIYQFSQQHQCQLVQSLQHEQTACYFVLSFANKANKISFIHPDICSDYYRNGTPLISADDVLAGRRLALTENGKDKTFYIATIDMEFIYYLIKKIDKGLVNQSHYDHLCVHYFLSPDKCKERMLGYWSSQDVEIIIESMLSKSVEQLQKALPGLQSSLNSRIRSSLSDHYRELKRKIMRAMQPAGVLIVILGPDGVGKTAVGDQLKTELSPAFRGVKRFHLRPYLIGSSGKGGGAPVTNPHGQPSRNQLSSMVKLIYFLADYSLGYLLRILPLKIRSNLIIFDRYYHDLLADPKRYRYGAPLWVARMVGRLIPKPDIFIVLDAPADTIHGRKQEVTMEETARQRTAYLDFAKTQRNCVVLNTSQALNNTVNAGCLAVMTYMQKREKMRLGH